MRSLLRVLKSPLSRCVTTVILAGGFVVSCGGSQDPTPTTAAEWDRSTLLTENWAIDAGALPTGPTGHPLRATAVDEEWRTWRGNWERSGTRLARGIASPEIIWSTEVGIQGYANTPMVTANRVFVTSQGSQHNYPDNMDGFYALDRSDGRQVWFFGTSDDVNGASLSDELVIGGTDGGRVYGVERATGRLAWEVEVGDPVRHGPVIVGNRAYVNGSTSIAIIDIDRGQYLGEISGESDDYDARGGLALSGSTILRAGFNSNVEVFDDEYLAWSTQLGEQSDYYYGYANYTAPMVVGDAVVALTPGSMDYQQAAMDLSVFTTYADGHHWTRDVEQYLGGDLMPLQSYLDYEQPYMVSLPWLMNGRLYYPQISSRYIVAYDFASGEPLDTIELPDCRSRQFSAIVGTPSRGYLARHDGTLYAFTPPTAELNWSLYLGMNAYVGQSYNTGSYYGAYGYDYDYCSAAPYDSTALFATPAIDENGVVYVGSGEGWIYAVGDTSW